jgi:hypothetical protein
MDGTWRWNELQGFPLEERKLALGFANANAGVLHWEWSRDDNFSVVRRDGSYKRWMDALRGITTFAKNASPYAKEAILPDVALVLPQSLQLSVFNGWAVNAQQTAVRALYNHARGSAIAVGEYQLDRLPDVRLIIVPSPSVLTQEAWDRLMTRVNEGATLLISGRIDADEHWRVVSTRSAGWNVGYHAGILATREVEVAFPDGKAQLSYSGDRTTFAERGFMQSGETFREISLGKGRILYVAPPLELADQLAEVGRIYAYAMRRAGVTAAYETKCTNPGIAICPTRLPDATLYVLTSEASEHVDLSFTDHLSSRTIEVALDPGRSALILVKQDGGIAAEYRPE